MIYSSLIAMAAISSTAPSAAEPAKIVIGDGQVNGSSIAPYEHVWSQCMAKEGKWQAGAPLTEKATVIGDHVLRIEQSGELPSGVRNKVSYYVDRESLAPIRTERTFSAPDGKLLASQQFIFDEDGYRATIFRQGQTQQKTGTLSSKMYNAMTLGIPLSTLDIDANGYSLQAFMTNFDGSYALIARKAGEETLVIDGRQVPVDWIDVEWLHEQTGDVYPPGPGGSGGRYWIAKEAGDEYPRVIRYQTDSYAIEFVQGVCPKPETPAPAETGQPSPR